MTKKDYIKIAHVFRRALYQANNPPELRIISTIESIQSDMCEMFKDDNNSFNMEKFYKECDYN